MSYPRSGLAVYVVPVYGEKQSSRHHFGQNAGIAFSKDVNDGYTISQNVSYVCLVSCKYLSGNLELKMQSMAFRNQHRKGICTQGKRNHLNKFLTANSVE